jgi:hypothetical protein
MALSRALKNKIRKNFPKKNSTMKSSLKEMNNKTKKNNK